MRNKYSKNVNKLSKEDKRKVRALLENQGLDHLYCRLIWRQLLGEDLYAIFQDQLVENPQGQPIETFTADNNITYEIVLTRGKYCGWSPLLANVDVWPQYEKRDLMPCFLPRTAKSKLAKIVGIKSVLTCSDKQKDRRPQWTLNAKKSVAEFYNSHRQQHNGVDSIQSVYEAYSNTNPHRDIKNRNDFTRCVNACKKGDPPLIGPWNRKAKSKTAKISRQ